MTTADPTNQTEAPPFQKCPQCGYSLRGLPTNHACPECGLKYDSNCGFYPLKNPRAMLAFGLCIFSGGLINLKHLGKITNLKSSTPFEIFLVFVCIVWILIMILFFNKLWSLYKRTPGAAVTTDGLLIRLPGFSEKLIPWQDLKEASIKPATEQMAQIVTIKRRHSPKPLTLSGQYNIFPTKADAERFVAQVNAKIASLSETH